MLEGARDPWVSGVVCGGCEDDTGSRAIIAPRLGFGKGGRLRGSGIGPYSAGTLAHGRRIGPVTPTGAAALAAAAALFVACAREPEPPAAQGGATPTGSPAGHAGVPPSGAPAGHAATPPSGPPPEERTPVPASAETTAALGGLAPGTVLGSFVVTSVSEPTAGAIVIRTKPDATFEVRLASDDPPPPARTGAYAVYYREPRGLAKGAAAGNEALVEAAQAIAKRISTAPAGTPVVPGLAVLPPKPGISL